MTDTSGQAAHHKPLVLVVDDDGATVELILDVLTCDQFEVEGHTDITAVLERVRLKKPQVVVLDLLMPGVAGMEMLETILEIDSGVDVILLTGHYSTDSAVEAIRRNKTYFTSRVAQMVLDGYLDKKPRPSSETDVPATRLTPRQREIVQLLAEGKSSKEVAVALGLSVKTAETHRANIMRRLDCHSVSELVRYAIRNNIIQP